MNKKSARCSKMGLSENNNGLSGTTRNSSKTKKSEVFYGGKRKLGLLCFATDLRHERAPRFLPPYFILDEVPVDRFFGFGFFLIQELQGDECCLEISIFCSSENGCLTHPGMRSGTRDISFLEKISKLISKYLKYLKYLN